LGNPHRAIVDAGAMGCYRQEWLNASDFQELFSNKGFTQPFRLPTHWVMKAFYERPVDSSDDKTDLSGSIARSLIDDRSIFKISPL
jgi:hypothetical protein